MKDVTFSLKQLHYFLVTSAHSSLRQAAIELRITQPSLSAQIRLLEESLGVTLFERTRGGISMTPVGREILPEVRQVVQAVRGISRRAEFASKGPSGMFRLGVSPSLGPYTLPWILPELHAKYREVKFFVREAVPNTLVDGLFNGDYDLIFSTMPINNPSFRVFPLFREPIMLVASAEHELAGKDKIQASDLDGQEVLTIEEHHLFFRQVESLCQRFNARILRDYEGTSLDAIRQMVYLEMGVAFLPALYIQSEIGDRRRDLAVMEVEGEPIFRVHALAWRTSSPLQAFYESLGEFFKDVIEQQFGEHVTVL